MTVKEFLVKTLPQMQAGIIRSRAVCADGFALSIQASHVHHCHPKQILANGDYDTVEVAVKVLTENMGLQFEKHSSMQDIITKSEVGSIMCYGNVKMRFLEKFVAEHGGII